MLRKGHDDLYKVQKMEEISERIRGEGDKIKFIDLGFQRGKVVEFRKGRRQNVG